MAYLDAIGARTVTVEAALAWAQRPDADPATSVWARRMSVARGFARHMSGVDPGTEIPPPVRDRLLPSPASATFFVSTAGTRLLEANSARRSAGCSR